MMSPSAVLTALIVSLSPTVQEGAVELQFAASEPIVIAAALQAPEPSVAAPTQPSSGLPQRQPDPRTLIDFWPVFVGFVITWLAIIGYLLSLGGRISRLGESLADLMPAEDV